MINRLAVSMMLAFAVPATALACWNDSGCPNDKVCECPSTSPTGNCSSEGQCVPDGRDWKSLKTELTKVNVSITSANYKAEDIKAAGNTVEKVSMRIEGKTGSPQPQYFTQKVDGKIVRIFDYKSDPPIWGVVNVSGVGTDIAIVEVRASGYPGGTFSSTITFQVMH